MFATVVVNQKTKDSWLISLPFLGFPLVPQLENFKCIFKCPSYISHSQEDNCETFDYIVTVVL